MQNLQFVIKHDPDYPGVQDKLVEVLLQINLPTATPYVTPNVTPTPDTRGVEAIFNQARSLIETQDWENAILTLDALRKEDSTYKTVDVDGMYYLALMQRGMAKIINPDCAKVNLEGGIYDLTLAERFGPLDKQADGLRNWARLYITGASFWEIDWNQVLYYFEQIKVSLPYLMDSSCVTSTARFRVAAIYVADQLLINREYCAANDYYQSALGIPNPDNSLVEPTAIYAYNHCQRSLQPEATDPPPSPNTPTPGITTTPEPSPPTDEP